MYRRLIVGFVFAGAIVLSATPALAGAWATTEFDGPLPDLVAGSSSEFGFTVLQHGRTPVTSGEVGIILHSDFSEAEVFFVAEPVGPPGHYVAEVRAPNSGRWELLVRQGTMPGTTAAFPDFPVGSVAVAATRGGAAMAGASSAAASPTAVAPETIATERPGSSVVGWLVAAVVVAAGIGMSIAGQPLPAPETCPASGNRSGPGGV